MKKKIILIVLSLLFILDLILVLTSNISIFDDAIYYGIISMKSNVLTEFFKVISFLASTKFIIVLNILIIIYMIIKKCKDLSIIVVASISSGVINNLVKFLVKRDRPSGIALIKENFYSFPSGHSMISLLFYGSIIYLLIKKKPNYYKVLVSIIAVFILLVGISRIYLGVHFASDVIGGYLLSTVILIIISSIMEKYMRSEK